MAPGRTAAESQMPPGPGGAHRGTVIRLTGPARSRASSFCAHLAVGDRHDR